MPAFDTILLATDLGDVSREAAGRAVELAAQLHARLLIVNVLERRRLAGGGLHARVDQARSEREPHLVEAVRMAREAGVSAEFLLWDGDPGEAIAAVAESEGADLVVVGTRARSGAGRLLLGSVSDQVIRRVPCPVLVVRRADGPTAGPGSEPSR